MERAEGACCVGMASYQGVPDGWRARTMTGPNKRLPKLAVFWVWGLLIS